MTEQIIRYTDNGYSAVVQGTIVGELVRCKDCRWSDWYTAGDGKKYCYCMETGVGGRTENDYCSYAEREKEE